MSLADVLPFYHQPSATLVTGGKLEARALPAVKAAGIQRVIDLLPEAEHDYDEASMVAAVGLAYENLPVAGAAGLNPETVRRFDALLQAGGETPTLIHCASANRVGALLALRAAWHQGASPEAALDLGRRAGLTKLEPLVQQLLMR
ncbi:MAG TPA: sulfur transferase domain-containing protein [Nevskiaceae bacterium]|nr:sulfur transferase domain-containing protein [Nevskiaceae bacterium]